MPLIKAAVGIGIVVATLALAALAVAGNTTVTLEDVSGVDHGNGTATYKGKLKGSKECRKGRKVKLDSTAAPSNPPRKLGSDRTSAKGKWSFDGPMISESQRIRLSVKQKGQCGAPYAFLRFDEVFG